MIAKIKNTYKKIEDLGLTDVRNIGLIIFGVLVLMVTWSGSKAISLNYELQKRVDRLAQENSLLELENESQKLRNEYYKSSTFRELAARRQLGRALPGERVYIVPKEVAEKYVPKPSEQDFQQVSAAQPVEKPFYQQNLEDWYNFFRHNLPVD
jgi:cell division protein FtsB